ncbi:hypothetical protein BRADI_3g27621v3 [Brachypodium distachyon]|uniref:Uncharacterized protein n=1 Tax=Brachypodium distachyon TaxID=15368 RepID=A0A0Q3HTM0_BRADI|nr:hypothetical protein BRADI_3g27621v3 [Brachypodium distachyon]
MQRPVERHGEAVAHQLVPHVHLRRRRCARAGEDVVASRVDAERARCPVMHGLRIDERHDEAPRRELQREVHRWDDVALQRERHHNRVQLAAAARRCAGFLLCHHRLPT